MNEYPLNFDVSKEFGPALVAQIVNLPESSKREFFERYVAKRKKLKTAYALGILLGVHYLYLGKLGLQIIFYLTMVVYVGLIWWVIDLFRMPQLIRDYNTSVALDLLEGYKYVNSPDAIPQGLRE